MAILTFGLGLACYFAFRVYRSPGRSYNGLLLIVALFFMWLGAVLALEAAGLSFVALLLAFGVILAGPLAVVVASVWLVFNGVAVVLREGLRLSTVLPLAFGGGSLAIIGFMVVGLRLNIGSPWLGGIVALVLFTYAYVGFQLVAYTAYALVYSRLPKLSRVDVIVVLGAGLGGGERVTPLLASRLRRGLQICDQQISAGLPSPMFVTSGGQGSDELLPEAEAMMSWLLEQKVPCDQIMQERSSTTTEQNLGFTQKLLADRPGSGRVVVVTSNYHVLRTASLARKLGLDWKVVGAPTAAYYAPTAFLREFIAHLTYAWKWHLFVGVLFSAAVGVLAWLSALNLA